MLRYHDRYISRTVVDEAVRRASKARQTAKSGSLSSRRRTPRIGHASRKRKSRWVKCEAGRLLVQPTTASAISASNSRESLLYTLPHLTLAALARNRLQQVEGRGRRGRLGGCCWRRQPRCRHVPGDEYGAGRLDNLMHHRARPPYEPIDDGTDGPRRRRFRSRRRRG